MKYLMCKCEPAFDAQSPYKNPGVVAHTFVTPVVRRQRQEEAPCPATLTKGESWLVRDPASKMHDGQSWGGGSVGKARVPEV